MPNKIFDTILQRKIENFVATFVDDSKSIFFKEKQLIHPGEYGKYRENSIKDLLSLLTQYKVSDGFIITSHDSVGTQCDIIVYDNSSLPILENNYASFFTIESVIAIGEVKSTLTYPKFKEALIKLAKNAKLYEEMNGTIKRKNNGEEHDNPITFLICKNLSFDRSRIDFEDIYKNIERKYWHQSILLVEEGLFKYAFDFNNLEKNYKKALLDNGFKTDVITGIERSSVTFDGIQYNGSHFFREMHVDTKFYHIMEFLAGISQSIHYKNLYDTHLIDYSSLNKANIYEDL